ncbi:hypothetical protein BDN70DRAFT_871226 [Pholiota conissans]|uniref:Uncharacterized protein n=1 Tax=Pholiota conissans TaxID=109636 RepID=A0A9P6D7C8_9AGAR|nr:hypothetical protein BDN70DRAFT_871226 [Pholiota conissans]
MPAKELLISLPEKALPQCNPNLMPFHIHYTGPALVSSFLRVKKFEATEVEKDGQEVTEDVVGKTLETKTVDKDSSKDVEMASESQEDAKNPSPSTDSANATPSLSRTDSQSTIAVSESKTPSLLSSASTSSATLASTTPAPGPPPLEDTDKRFVSAFRGRTIHGLTIDLPTGFGGLVMQTENPNQAKAGLADPKTNARVNAEKSSKKGKKKKVEEEAPSTRRRGRLTRSALASSNPTKPIEVVDDEPDEVMADATASTEQSLAVEDMVDAEDATATRYLVPTAQFSSFTLWQPDRVVDKGRDEYYRSITEWISLANEIHRTD